MCYQIFQPQMTQITRIFKRGFTQILVIGREKI